LGGRFGPKNLYGRDVITVPDEGETKVTGVREED